MVREDGDSMGIIVQTSRTGCIDVPLGYVTKKFTFLKSIL